MFQHRGSADQRAEGVGRARSGSAACLSIGVPVYNGQRFIRQAIDSVLDQPFGDFELIIGDNGSTDETQAICEAYAAQDRRIRYVRSEKNMGAAWNYNRVFELASGEYFKWAACDDLTGSGLFESAIRWLNTYPGAGLAYGRTIRIDAQGARLGVIEDRLDLRSSDPVERFHQFLQVYRRPAPCNPVYGVFRSEALRATPLIGGYVSSDMVLLGEMALRGQILEIPDGLFYRREHPDTSVRANPDLQSRTKWFDPKQRRLVQAPRWRWLKEYAGAIRRAPLSNAQRLACYQELAGWVVANAPGFTKELGQAAAWPLVSLLILMKAAAAR